MEKTKVIVIGGGPGGYVAAIRAAQLGAQVTLIEEEKLGGTCLNKGCIPTKALLSSAHAMETAAGSSHLGVEAEPRLHWDKVQENKAAVVARLVGGVEGLLRANGVKVVRGRAAFLSADTVTVKAADGSSNTLKSDKFILATGSVPAIPPVPGVENEFCIDSSAALALEECPRSIAIVGGGVIGVELAFAYRAFGSDVTLIEMADTLLPGMDADGVKALTARLEAAGVRMRTSAAVKEFGRDSEGPFCQVDAGGEERIHAEKMLICTGRKPELQGLGLEKAGVCYDRFVKVDSRLQTSAKNVYAIGDCNGLVMLASAASAQGMIAAENCLGGDSTFDAILCPRTVFSSPELAAVGMDENELREKKAEYTVGFFPAFGNGRSVIEGDTSGFTKIFIGKKYGEILGAVVCGPQANELISTLTLAIEAEATVDELTRMCFGHPILGECLHEAALAAQNRAIHVPNKRR